VSTPSASDWTTALHASHDRLVGLVSSLDEAAITAPSYDSEWSIGQVLSHLGSQAEIFDLFVDAVQAGEPVPGGDVFPPIWDRWNAKSPLEWRDDFVSADTAALARIEALDPETFRIALFGMDLDLAGFVRMRLSEHALHTWDVAVALDPTAQVSPDAVALLIDGIGMMAARAGKGSATPYRVRVGTADPSRDLVVSVGEAVSIDAAEPDDSYDGSVDLPAEAFLRLVAGRLDTDHAPVWTESGARGVADLRTTFPGF
jgi:uncharacterized protein (TIGR03083 family)